MKVIGISNFDNESVSDILVHENLLDEAAEEICEANNSCGGHGSMYYYKVVPDDHKLYEFKP